MFSLLNIFTTYIQKENLFQKKDNLILAVSGGIDSVVLCELCSQAGFNFKIAHCNFQLRGEESVRDETFVQQLGEKYNVPVITRRFATNEYATEKKISIQVAARELRYKWFDELLNEDSAKTNPPSQPTFLLTAHHANDNVETLLMNFFKGTGIKGLRGILPKQGKIIRPLLFGTKEAIRSFAGENNLGFVEDSSNLSDKYTRNYFRNQLIPSVEKVFPKVEENLLDNISRFNDISELYLQAITLHKKKLLVQVGNEIHIPVLKLQKARPLQTIVYEIIKDYSFTSHQTVDVLHLLKSESGKYISSSTHKIIRNRKWIIITPNNSQETSLIIISENTKHADFPEGKLVFEKTRDNTISSDSSIAVIDADTVKYPLILRRWKQGDYFYPLGMKKKKKLSRFLIDLKISMPDKEKTWVIESDKKIFWVIDKRIDDRFKITTQTKHTLKIKLVR